MTSGLRTVDTINSLSNKAITSYVGEHLEDTEAQFHFTAAVVWGVFACAAFSMKLVDCVAQSSPHLLQYQPYKGTIDKTDLYGPHTRKGSCHPASEPLQVIYSTRRKTELRKYFYYS